MLNRITFALTDHFLNTSSRDLRELYKILSNIDILI